MSNRDDPSRANPVDVMVGERVRAERIRKGMSQGDLAAKLGVSSQQVQKYEKGTDRLSASRLHAIARALEMLVGFFLDELNAMADTDKVIEIAHRTSESIRLNQAFLKIENPRLRRHAVDLVQSIADAATEDRTAWKGKGRRPT